MTKHILLSSTVPRHFIAFVSENVLLQPATINSQKIWKYCRKICSSNKKNYRFRTLDLFCKTPAEVLAIVIYLNALESYLSVQFELTFKIKTKKIVPGNSDKLQRSQRQLCVELFKRLRKETTSLCNPKVASEANFIYTFIVFTWGLSWLCIFRLGWFLGSFLSSENFLQSFEAISLAVLHKNIFCMSSKLETTAGHWSMRIKFILQILSYVTSIRMTKLHQQ